jgi:hypothetical protein
MTTMYELMNITVRAWIAPDNNDRAAIVERTDRERGALAYRAGEPYHKQEKNGWRLGWLEAQRNDGKGMTV